MNEGILDGRSRRPSHQRPLVVALYTGLSCVLYRKRCGALAFVSPETCGLSVSDQQQPDGGCPAFCARCGCCAQPVVRAVRIALAPAESSVRFSPVHRFERRSAAPADILHVPKTISLNS